MYVAATLTAVMMEVTSTPAIVDETVEELLPSKIGPQEVRSIVEGDVDTGDLLEEEKGTDDHERPLDSVRPPPPPLLALILLFELVGTGLDCRG
jgi:hypothetical protein